MDRRRLRICGGAMLSAVVCTAAVARAQDEKKSDPKTSGNVAAYVGGEPITLAEVDAKALGTNMTLAQQLYDARRTALDQIILERALAPKAKAAGLGVEEFIDARMAEKNPPVSDEAVEKFYQSNQARMGGRTLEQMSAQIRNYLAGQQQGAARQQLLADVTKEANVRVTLDAPRVEVAIAANDPMIGPKDADVTIVEYSDFQ